MGWALCWAPAGPGQRNLLYVFIYPAGHSALPALSPTYFLGPRKPTPKDDPRRLTPKDDASLGLWLPVWFSQ